MALLVYGIEVEVGEDGVARLAGTSGERAARTGVVHLAGIARTSSRTTWLEGW